ncbi:MAG: hypothetical protein AAF564_19035, partial [Bacteroidota bacterium]
KRSLVKKTVGFILAVFFLLPACDQQVDPLSELAIPPDGQMLRACNDQKMWSAALLRESLVGEWRWYYTYNGFTPNAARNTLERNTVVTLNSDSTLQVMEAGETTYTTRWSVENVYEDLYGLETTSSTPFTLGHINLCDDLLEFDDSNIDGDNNFFVRTN